MNEIVTFTCPLGNFNHCCSLVHHQIQNLFSTKTKNDSPKENQLMYSNSGEKSDLLSSLPSLNSTARLNRCEV